MKLAVVTDCLSQNAGGMFHSVRRLAQELQNHRVDVRVFGVADNRTAIDLSHWAPLEPCALRPRGPRIFGYAAGLPKAIASERPAVIQNHGLWKYNSYAVLRASSFLRCPYLVHPEGMLDPWALRQSRWKKRLAEWAYEGRHLRGAACIRALNESEAAAIRNYGLRNPICVVPNAVDLPDKQPSPGATHGADDRPWPVAVHTPSVSDRKTLLYLGRIHPKKGLANLLEAWKLVSEPSGGRPSADWQLAIAGWDQAGHEAELRRRAAELGLDGRVVFLGPRFGEEKAACFRHCDAFVLPSFSEGLPMAVLEAWAYSKPVLMTPQCNLPNGFTAGAALSVEPSPDSIAGGLRTLMEMAPAERESMGRRGLALVKKQYRWPEVARQMHEVYDWVLGGGPAPAFVERLGGT